MGIVGVCKHVLRLMCSFLGLVRILYRYVTIKMQICEVGWRCLVSMVIELWRGDI